jgi:DNA polymerase-3 subunit epsilon
MNTKNLPANTFVAVDVEWATRDQMICQIGLAVVRNGKIDEHAQWLIQPPGNEYDETLYRSHHVRPEMTETSPTLEELWSEIQPYLLIGELWAHNAVAAEIPAFQKSLAEYGIPCEWLCIRDSRELFQRHDCPYNSGNGLTQCCMAMSIPFEESEHHDALYDAEKLAELLIALQQGRVADWTGVPVSTEQLRKSQQGKRVLRLGEFAGYYAQKHEGDDVFAVLTSTYAGAPEQEVDVFDTGDKMPKAKDGVVDIARLKMGEGSALNGRKVVLTGEFAIKRSEIERAIVAMGGKKISGVTKNTDAIIIGPINVSGGKLTDLEEQESKGHRIARIVGDADLEELLYGDGHKFFAEL